MKCFIELITLHDIRNKEPFILQVRSYCIYSMNVNIFALNNGSIMIQCQTNIRVRIALKLLKIRQTLCHEIK